MAFDRKDDDLWVEDVAVRAIVEQVGTPFFVYSASVLRERVRAVRGAFDPLGARVRYAVKANPNLAVLRLLLAEGCGMDVVSEGELRRALLSGCPGSSICFAGVSKSERELRLALGAGRQGEPVGMINVESEGELRLLDRVAAVAGVVADALVRVNPEVDAQTHQYTTTGLADSKFGVEAARAISIFEDAARFSRVRLLGLHAHIGSPIREPDRYAAAACRLAGVANEIRRRGGAVTVLNCGGGFAHASPACAAEPVSAYAAALREALSDEIARGTRLLIEPGRVIAAGAGLLVVGVTHVKHTKHRSFALCDAGMNAFARPALYQAAHRVEAVKNREGAAHPIDIAGPLCESSDFLARERCLPPVRAGDSIAVFDAGAYGMSMASNYNEHPKPAEVLVDGDRWAVVRARQTYDDLVRHDQVPDWLS